MNMKCISCGKCCKKQWLLRLTSEHEKSMFKDVMVFGNFIWTNECPYLKNNKCIIHQDKPYKCKEYLCEKYA